MATKETIAKEIKVLKTQFDAAKDAELATKRVWNKAWAEREALEAKLVVATQVFHTAHNDAMANLRVVDEAWNALDTAREMLQSVDANETAG